MREPASAGAIASSKDFLLPKVVSYLDAGRDLERTSDPIQWLATGSTDCVVVAFGLSSERSETLLTYFLD